MNFKSLYIAFVVLAFFISSCSKDTSFDPDSVDGYDIVLVIGQSNTHQGLGYDPTIDTTDPDVKQLGRFDHDMKIIEAKEPLDHITKLKNQIGFALTFSKLYKNTFLEKNRKVLIIPAGKGSTGFGDNDWNPGDTLYNDAVYRTNYIVNKYENSKIVPILWHQGENDIGNPDYQLCLDQMITQIRNDILNNNHQEIPFILGGMVPYWCDQDTTRIKYNNIIANTKIRLDHIGYANPRIPFVIEKELKDSIPMHYDAMGQRELGQRYFDEFQLLKNN